MIKETSMCLPTLMHYKMDGMQFPVVAENDAMENCYIQAMYLALSMRGSHYFFNKLALGYCVYRLY